MAWIQWRISKEMIFVSPSCRASGLPLLLFQVIPCSLGKHWEAFCAAAGQKRQSRGWLRMEIYSAHGNCPWVKVDVILKDAFVLV